LQAAHEDIDRLREADTERPSWVLRWGLDVGILVTSGGAGALLVADDVPEGLRWSAVTLAVGTLVGRLIVETLGRHRGARGPRSP